MRLRWTPAAAEDLESIYTYLCEHHPSFAQPTIRLLYDSARSLCNFSGRGRPGTISDTRELVLRRLPYIIVYRVTDQIIEILRIYHGAQDR
jgi:toxin ParE1/3/4